MNKTSTNSARSATLKQASPMLTVEVVAERLKVSERTVRRWIDAGFLRAVRLGRLVRVFETDLQALIDSGR
jgi:excisionase family DNA binding protein